MIIKTFKGNTKKITDKETLEFFIDDKNYVKSTIRQIYDEKIYDSILNRLIEKNQVKKMIDCGANVGLFSFYCSDVFDKIYSFEPSDIHFNICNNILPDNVILKKLAISNRSGTVDFYINNANSTTNSLIGDFGGNKISCNSTSINEFIYINKIDVIDFIKIDIEGSEVIALDNEFFNMTCNKLNNIYIETHNTFQQNGKDSSANADYFQDKLSSIGFNVQRINIDSLFAEKQ